MESTEDKEKFNDNDLNKNGLDGNHFNLFK